MGRRTLLVALGATLLLLGNPITVAADTANCVGNTPNSFAANYDAATLPVTGYYSHLDPQSLLICTNPFPSTVRGSFSWSAIQRGDADEADCDFCIVQIGRGACDDPANPSCVGTSQRLFTAWGRRSTAPGCDGQQDIIPAPANMGPAPTDTGLQYYRVWRDGTYWRFDHWPKGQAVVQVRLISQSLICWGNRTAVTFNETFNTSDSLGGTPTNPYNFLSMARQAAVGGAWSPTSLNAAAPCGFLSLDPIGADYRCDVTASQAWEAWTDR